LRFAPPFNPEKYHETFGSHVRAEAADKKLQEDIKAERNETTKGIRLGSC